MLIWRAVQSGKVTLGEVNRGEVSLDQLLRLNALLDFEQAVQHAIAKKTEG